MTETIQAIETRYAGCRFRSRLEARWAVFFDHLGIRWEYEPQGYELPDGGRYLPDFFLPDTDMFVEVKGAGSALTQDADRLRAFVVASWKHLVILGDVPACDRDGVPAHSTIVSVTDRTELVISIMINTGTNAGWGFLPFWARFDDNPTTAARYVEGLTVSPLARDAYLAARGARFEFGEQG